MASDQSEVMNGIIENYNWALFRVNGDSDDVVDLTNQTMIVKV